MKKLSLYCISLLFIGGGIMHFTHDADLAAITPLPFAYEIVWLTGVMEFFFALFLLSPRYSKATALWLSLFCLAVLPANINMAVHDLPMFGAQVDAWVLWLRIPMQFLLIAWLLYASDAFVLLRKLGIRALVYCENSASGVDAD